MTITVKGPDGNSYQFPDGTPPDVMRNAMQQRYGGPQSPQNPQPQQPPQMQAASPVQGQDAPLSPEHLQHLGLPEGTTREQARQHLQQKMDDAQQHGDKAQQFIDRSNAVMKPLNAIQRFSNSATLGVPDRVFGMGIDAKNAITGHDAEISGYQHVKNQKEILREQFPKSSVGADVGGAVFGLGKLSAAKALPSQLAARIPGATAAATKAGKLVSSTAGVALDGAVLAGAEAAIGGRDALKSALQGGGFGAGLNVVTRGAAGALAPLLKGKKSPMPSTADIFEKAKGKYDEIRKMDIEFDKGASASLVKGITDDIMHPSVGLDKKLHRGTRGLLKDISEFAGKTMPNARLQDFATRAKELVGNGGADGVRGQIILDNIEKFALSSPKTVTGDASKLSEATKLASELWRRGSNAKTLEDAIDIKKLRTSGSGTGGNSDNNIRQAMTNMLASNKGSKFLNDAEKAAMKEGIKGTKVQNAARLFGRGFSPTTGALNQLATGAMLAKTGGTSLPLHVAGFAAKKFSDKAALDRADDVLRMLRSGGDEAALARQPNKVQKIVKANTSDEEKKKQLARLLTAGAIS